MKQIKYKYPKYEGPRVVTRRMNNRFLLFKETNKSLCHVERTKKFVEENWKKENWAILILYLVRSCTSNINEQAEIINLVIKH